MKNIKKRNCELCGIVFYDKYRTSGLRTRRFCSRACSYKSPARSEKLSKSLTGKRCSPLTEFKKTPPLERFFSYIKKKKNKCWEWQLQGDKNGYGSFSITGKAREALRAHRASWILFVGEIPKGMLVCHKCDNPPCVNPKHLFLGTNNDNMIDKMLKDRQTKGENVNTNILNREQVIKIRKSPKTPLQLAEEFGITRASIYDILTFRSWKWL